MIKPSDLFADSPPHELSMRAAQKTLLNEAVSIVFSNDNLKDVPLNSRICSYTSVYDGQVQVLQPCCLHPVGQNHFIVLRLLQGSVIYIWKKSSWLTRRDGWTVRPISTVVLEA